MITDELKVQLIEAAKTEYPNEMCGLIVKVDDECQFVQCENISSEPLENFQVNEFDYLKCAQLGEIVAVVHSHTNEVDCLTIPDMRNQLQEPLDWVLVNGDMVRVYRPIKPLIGRNFEFNKQDCYNLFRDCYMLAGVDFPEFTYSEDWYFSQNLYVENLIKYGFEQVSSPELGDVILFNTDGEIANHCGVFLGEQLFLHHSYDRLSKRELLDGYWYKYTHSYWRYKWKSQLNFTAVLDNLEIRSH